MCDYGLAAATSIVSAKMSKIKASWEPGQDNSLVRGSMYVFAYGVRVVRGFRPGLVAKKKSKAEGYAWTFGRTLKRNGREMKRAATAPGTGFTSCVVVRLNVILFLCTNTYVPLFV